MKLGNRLTAIAGLVEPQSRIADIGTDHGYLSAYLYEQKCCAAIYASDLNKGPLKAAEDTLQELGISEGIILRLGGGFAPYKRQEIDSAVIAGMGGALIAQIIEDHIELAKGLNYMILQPMQAPEALRAYLLSNGFVILREQIAREGNKFYEIIKCKAGVSQDIEPLKQEIGYCFDHTEQYEAFLAYRLNRHRIILDSLSRQDQEVYAEEIQKHRSFAKGIQEVLHAYQL